MSSKNVYSCAGDNLEVELAGFGRIKLSEADTICQERFKNFLEARWSETEGSLIDDGAEALMDGQQYTKNGRIKVLKPNVTYTANGYTYATDDFGRISSAEGNLVLDEATRNAYAQRIAGRVDRITGNVDLMQNDDGGHLIASMFNGSGDIDNLVAMNAQINRSGGKWYQIEQDWAKALRGDPANNILPETVQVKVKPIYSSQGISQRPIKFDISYKIGNEDWIEETLLNQIGG